MGQTQDFFNLLKDFVISFYWICSITVFIHKSDIWKKIWFLRYGPKFSQPIKLQDFLNNHMSRTNQWHVDQKILGCCVQKWVQPVWSWDSKIDLSQEWSDGLNWFFLHADANSGKLTVILLNFWWTWSKKFMRH